MDQGNLRGRQVRDYFAGAQLCAAAEERADDAGAEEAARGTGNAPGVDKGEDDASHGIRG